MMPSYPLAIATVKDQMQYKEMIEDASALYVFYGVDSMLGPLIMSQFMDQFGPGGLYLFMAFVMGLYIPFGLFRLCLVPDFMVRGNKATYRTIPRTTAMAYRILKRPRRRNRKNGKLTDSMEPKEGCM